MPKPRQHKTKPVLIAAGIVSLLMIWYIIIKGFSSFYRYSFTDQMAPDTQKKFRNEYLMPLCHKLLKSPVQFDADLSETEKLYWMSTRFSILTKFNNCEDFASYPELRHDTEEFARHDVYIAKYDFGKGKTYEIEILELPTKKMEFNNIKGLDDTLVCYGENLSLPYVQKWNAPAHVNREAFFNNLNSQCKLKPQ